MIALDSTGGDADTVSLVADSADALRQLAGFFSGERDAPPDAAAFNTGVTDIERLRAAAKDLYGQQDFQRALPVAMQWLMMQPFSSEAAFVLATCLQRAGKHELSLATFGMCAKIQDEQLTPAPLLGAAECLLALGRKEHAAAAFQAVVELAAKNGQYHEISVLAQANIDAMQQ